MKTRLVAEIDEIGFDLWDSEIEESIPASEAVEYLDKKNRKEAVRILYESVGAFVEDLKERDWAPTWRASTGWQSASSCPMMTETKTCIRCGLERPLSMFERPNAPCRPPRKWCSECWDRVRTMRKSRAQTSDAELLAAMNAAGKNGQTAWQRYWSYVEKRPGGCWIWNGAKSGDSGYGTFTVGGYGWRTNRLAYALKHGVRAIRGVMVCHSCDTPSCVNPAHLWTGEHLDNRGSRNSAAVLDEETVMMLRRSKLPHAVWARRLGVHATTIHSARVGKKWKHLPEAWPRTERVQ